MTTPNPSVRITRASDTPEYRKPWTPKPGDKAYFVGDTEVIIVAESKEYPGIFDVRYAQKDNFGDRATFSADREELTPRG